MSNYVFLVHDPSASRSVNAWLDRHAAASDVVRVRLGLRRRLIIVSKDARRSTRPGRFFRGTAIAPDHNALVFGVDGWLASPDAVRSSSGDHAGEYLAAEWGAQRLELERDVFGSARLMHTAAPGIAAASDSLLVLASLRRAVGARVTANAEVLVARTAKNAVAGQQISPETILNEVSYVPAARGLSLDVRGLRWSLTGAPVADRVASDGLDYVEVVRQGAADVARTVATLAAVPGWSATLSLSGGYDSRLVLAGIVATGTNDAYRVRIVDNGPASEADVRVANSLARQFDVAPTAFGAPLPADAEDEYSHWAANLLGVYDGYGPVRTARWHARTFGLTGIGAEIHKGNWGWRPLHALADTAAPGGAVHDALSAQLAKAADSVGAVPTAGNASELYYLGYRNGIHGAAGHIGVHMTGVHPVMQLRLAQLGHLPYEDGFRGSPAGIADHGILLAPEVAAHEYDDPRRNLSPGYVDERLAALGGRIGAVDGYEVHGHPDDVVDGPSMLSLSIARELGLHGPLNADHVMARAEDALGLISDPDVRQAYVDVRDNAAWRIAKQNGSLKAAGISPARISMLEILRLTT
ncbi:hypothetical protein [Agromyces soli]|uniref:Asparagine synthetase domain-containing protein n=1 Tax=Agromyces soli TaxID=659012 RepID=A0ABY4ANZ6_9MICO|nr:hypothetical protein [Agromyces soli]UOE24725.1 hypothetical protein MTP13_10115 [Agromyces soli]